MSGSLELWSYASLSKLISAGGLFSDGDWIESKDQDPNGAIRLLQLADIGDGIFLNKSNRFINDEKFFELRCTELQEGDLLIARMPDPLGRACMMPKLPQRCITVVDVAVIRPGRASVQPKWLMHFLNAPSVRQEIELQSSGTTRRRISHGNLSNLELPIPPLNEQKRIAAKLDAVLAQVDACRDRLARIPTILQRFRQSILADATSGKLTEAWRNGEPINWKFERAADICSKVQSGGTPKEGFIEQAGIPFLKVYNIVNQKVAFDYRPQYIDQKIHNKSLLKSRTLPGDVLMNIVGPPLGKVAVVPAAFTEWNINQAITLFRPSERISTGWLYYVLCGGENISNIVHETHGSAGQANISLSQCRDFIFPVPPIEEQTEIVRRVESLFAYADRLQSRYTAARAQVEKLPPAILSKAFCGELIPQDPHDEPASVLLEQIHATTLGKTKQIKTTRKAPMTKHSTESVKAIIRQMPQERFSFDELTNRVPTDYEALKNIVFALLSESEPLLRQIFDREAGAMRLEKVQR